MPSEGGSQTAHRWLRLAKADLAMAASPLPEGGLYELLCYHAQQAAEKALKAVLLSRGAEPPKTHVIQTLLDLLPDDIRGDVPRAASALTVYATAARCPSVMEPVTEAECATATAAAQAVVDWADGSL